MATVRGQDLPRGVDWAHLGRKHAFKLTWKSVENLFGLSGAEAFVVCHFPYIFHIAHFPSFVLFLKQESRNFLLSLTVNFLFCARFKQHQANSEIDFQFLMTHVRAMENHRTSHYKRSVRICENRLSSWELSFTMSTWINNNYQSWRIDDWKLKWFAHWKSNPTRKLSSSTKRKRVVIQCIVNSELGQSIIMGKYWKNKSKHNVYCFDDMYNNSSTGINKVWHVTSDVLNRITYSQLVVWLWT